MNEMCDIFLTALKSALQGEKALTGRELLPEEWQALFELAEIHRVLPLVYQAVHTAPSLQEKQPALAVAVKRQVRIQMMIQTQKTNDFLQLIRALEAEGLQPLVVKGIVCRSLYPQPDLRPSGDEDLLIPASQFGNYHRALQALDMQAAMAPDAFADSYEVPYRKADSHLYIELHKHLFAPGSDAYGDMEQYFAGVHERSVTLDIQGAPVRTMGHTDHLFYLLCHAFKHFLHSGFGIRQVCDIILYAQQYGAQTDWSYILENCKKLRADRFAAAIFRIGSNYLGFDPNKAAYPGSWRRIRVDETAMLEDLLSGGLYGDANMSRKHSSNMTLSAFSSQKQGKKSGNGMLLSVFPPARKLEHRYPYLKARPYLVPVAWGDRIWRYAQETAHTGGDTVTDALKIGNERIELMKQYGILK